MFCCHPQVEAFDAVGAQDRHLLKLASYSAFIITFLLVVCRLAAFFASRSYAVEASVADAAKDCLVSSINAFLILKSIRPADPSFPFGYGKVEALAALFQAMFLLATGGFVVANVIQGAAAHDHSVACTSTALTSLILSIVLAFALSLIQTHIARRTKSMAVLADAIHYRTDVLMNIGIIFCFLISVKSAVFDILLGVGLAIYLMVSAWIIGRKALLALLDHGLAPDVVQALNDTVTAAGGEIASLRTHSSGRGEFIVLQIAESPSMTLSEFHKKQMCIERKVHERFPRSFVIIAPSHDDSVSLNIGKN